MTDDTSIMHIPAREYVDMQVQALRRESEQERQSHQREHEAHAAAHEREHQQNGDAIIKAESSMQLRLAAETTRIDRVETDHNRRMTLIETSLATLVGLGATMQTLADRVTTMDRNFATLTASLAGREQGSDRSSNTVVVAIGVLVSLIGAVSAVVAIVAVSR
jgi:hypothetical protein